jgi:protein involved in sex pheromone biosynthesis
MPKETNHLLIKLSDKLKDDFKAMCDEREVSMSSATRELIANSVRNYKRNEKKAGEREDK